MPQPATPSPVQTSTTEVSAPKTNALGLSTAQVIGSALAAATSALAASFLGVAGTIIGAVVGSLVATIASAVYAHSLRQASTRIRDVRPIIVTRHADTSAHEVQGPGRHVVTDPSAGSLPAQPQADGSPPRRTGSPPRRTVFALRWAGVAAGVVVAAGLALGGITGVEALLGHPVSNSSATGTSLGKAFGGSNAPTQKQPRSPSTPKPSSTPGTGETAKQGGSPAGTVPPTNAPQPTRTPTAAPTVSAPVTTGPAEPAPTVQPTGPAAPQTQAPTQTAR